MTSPPLVLVAHGSSDPRFGEVVEAIASRVRARRPELEVRIGYLEHGPPHVPDVSAGGVLVPLLLASGYHVTVDLPSQVGADVSVARAVGPDERLAVAVADRLREAGYDGESPVVLAAAGSSDPAALDDVRLAARQLASVLGVEVTAAFVSTGSPRLDEAVTATPGAALASYLVAPGAFHDTVVAAGRSAGGVVSDPIGDHPGVADVALSRYDETVFDQPPGRTAPA